MPPPDPWNPATYERFREERGQPFFDLLALVEKTPTMRAIDLGCGTGEWTRHLHTALGAATTFGLDRSEAMLAKTSILDAAPGLTFGLGDIAEWASARPEAETYDLVFSNAALHWLPAHETLLRSISRALRAHGQLAVQVPANFDHPTHRVASEVAMEPEFAAALHGSPSEPEVLSPESYATLLHRLGFARQHVRLQVYAHVLASRDEAVEWVRGTLLTQYEARLSPEIFATFLSRYRARLFAELPDERPFFYPFKRILLWGAK